MTKRKQDQMEELIQCSICRDVFDDPRLLLQCEHTFCRRCLELTVQDKRPGDLQPCPLCRTPFRIPGDGIVGLPRNLVVDQLVEIWRPSRKIVCGAKCDICRRGESADSQPDVGNVAKWRCLTCDESFCDACSTTHQNMRISRSHLVYKIASDSAAADYPLKADEGFCRQHVNNLLEFRCNDCQQMICASCYDDHRDHKLILLDSFSDELRAQMHSDVAMLAAEIYVLKKIDEELAATGSRFVGSLKTVEQALKERCNAQMSLIDNNELKLTMELNQLRRSREMLDFTKKKEIMARLTECENLSVASEDVIQKSTSLEVYRVARNLREKAIELCSAPPVQIPAVGNVAFVESEAKYNTRSTMNFVGKLAYIEGTPTGACKENEFEVYHVMFELPAVAADCLLSLALVGDKVYTGRDSSPVIGVHSVTTFQPLPSVTIPSFRGVYSMSSCNHYSCLYIIECDTGLVRRMSVPQGQLISWSVNATGVGDLSVSKITHHVLVACRAEVKEFSTDGQLLRQVRFAPRIAPFHVVDLQNGGFVVAQMTLGQELVAVSNNLGAITKTFRLEPNTVVKNLIQKWCPFAVAVDSLGYIYVADCLGYHIVLLSPSLELVRVINTTNPSGRLVNVEAMVLDEPSGRLYVAFNNGYVVYYGVS